MDIPLEIAVKIAKSLPWREAEYLFNALVRAIPSVGRRTIGTPSLVINTRLNLMIELEYTVYLGIDVEGYQHLTWLKNNERHRNDVPARTWCGGDISWWKHGGRHRRNGPAVICNAGNCQWWQHDCLHRDDGLPADMQCSSSCISWRVHWDNHREEGPARICGDGYLDWRQRGHLYRVNGPYIIHPDGITGR